jgi:hypothetical protein
MDQPSSRRQNVREPQASTRSMGRRKAMPKAGPITRSGLVSLHNGGQEGGSHMGIDLC